MSYNLLNQEKTNTVNLLLISFRIVLVFLLSGCATTYQIELRRIMDAKTEWEKADENVLAERQAKKLDDFSAFNRLLANCVSYSTYQYQRTLCSSASFVLDLGLPDKLLADVFKQEFVDSGELAKLAVFPKIPTQMQAYDHCMENGEPVLKVVCVELSRILEHFANGKLSLAEFKRQNAQYSAVLETYYKSQPTAGDFIFSALKLYADSIPKTTNCYGQVTGNQVYAQCR